MNEISRIDTGTAIGIHSPRLASQCLDKIDGMVTGFCLFNPHAQFIVDGKDYQPAPVEKFKKWLPSQPCSAHWYDGEAFSKLAADTIHTAIQSGRRSPTIQNFIKDNFEGVQRTEKRKLIGEAMAPATVLDDLANGKGMDRTKTNRLLGLLKEATVPVKPARLGCLGQRFLSDFLSAKGYPMEHFRYKKIELTLDDSPTILEAAFTGSPNARREIFWGLNFTPMLSDVPWDISWILQSDDVLIDSNDPIVLVIHITRPKFRFKDRGKGTLELTRDLIKAIGEGLTAIAKDWAKIKRRKRRDQQTLLKELKPVSTIKKLKPKQVAFSVMEQAYMQASNNNSLPASARQIFYQIRPLILGQCSDEWSYKSFSDWLPEFIKQFPEITRRWNVTYDPRGKFYEPHTSRMVELGTKGVRDYINDLRAGIGGHCNQFRFALFIEKEGFSELFDAVNLGKRYDIAIFSTKGYSTTACRELVDYLSSVGVTILCAHDFDCAGLNIYATLAGDNDRYTYSDKPNVVDLGLRLSDVEEMGLDSEPVKYDKTPLPSLKKNGCSQAEIDFLCSHKTSPFSGSRVELNAMPSNVLIDWLERKFSEHGVTKFVPDESILVESYQVTARRHLLEKFMNEKVNELIEEERKRIAGLEIPIPDKLVIAVQDQLKARPLIPWNKAVERLAAQFIEPQQENLAS
jgi:hypothetical protein